MTIDTLSEIETQLLQRNKCITIHTPSEIETQLLQLFLDIVQRFEPVSFSLNFQLMVISGHSL